MFSFTLSCYLITYPWLKFKLIEGRDFRLLRSLLYPQCLEQWPAYSRHSVSICGTNLWSSSVPGASHEPFNPHVCSMMWRAPLQMGKWRFWEMKALFWGYTVKTVLIKTWAVWLPSQCDFKSPRCRCPCRGDNGAGRPFQQWNHTCRRLGAGQSTWWLPECLASQRRVEVPLDLSLSVNGLWEELTCFSRWVF